MLQKITRKVQENLGLTRSESAVILFLALAIIVGETAKLLSLDRQASRYDFTQSDSFFVEASSKIDSILAAEEDSSKNAKRDRALESKLAAFPVDINSADLTGLTAIPGIGKVIAQRIIDYRNAHGKFNNIEELRNVKGIGEKKLARIRQLVKAG